MPEAWYAAPAFYFSNPGAVYRHGDDIPKPPDTEALDYELELALERIRATGGVVRTVTEVVLSTLFQR